MIKLQKRFCTTSVIAIFIYLTSPAHADTCDIDNIIFSPSYNSVDQDNWYRRGESQFSIEIIGNGKCSAILLDQVSLTNTSGVNVDTDALNDARIQFDEGSNNILLNFNAGEEGCTAVAGKSDCQLEIFIRSPATKHGYWSGGNAAILQKGYKDGKLKYECDKRFLTCNGSIKFELVNISSGKIVQ
ncbi:hypothetical protein CKO09_12095 [Chromatium weissei]|nr:hypothetical protein [Chromatium weissei]